MPGFYPIGDGVIGDYISLDIDVTPLPPPPSPPPPAPGSYNPFMVDMAGVAQDLINDFGWTSFITLFRQVTTPNPVDPTDSTNTVLTTGKLAAAMFGYSDERINGDTIHIGDREIYIAGNILTDEPKNGDVAVIDGVPHAVISVNQTPASGIVALYTLQVRTANAR